MESQPAQASLWSLNGVAEFDRGIGRARIDVNGALTEMQAGPASITREIRNPIRYTLQPHVDRFFDLRIDYALI